MTDPTETLTCDSRPIVPEPVADLVARYEGAVEYLRDHGIDEKQAWKDATGLQAFLSGPHPPSVAMAIIQLSRTVYAEARGDTVEQKLAWNDGKETRYGRRHNAVYAGAKFFANF